MQKKNNSHTAPINIITTIIIINSNKKIKEHDKSKNENRNMRRESQEK
jgi:hypothetical protein